MAEASDPTDSWLNFQLICKPEQSGKTFIMIQQIIKDMKWLYMIRMDNICMNEWIYVHKNKFAIKVTIFDNAYY